MADWEVLTDKQSVGKRLVLIHDTVNDRQYSNYFPLSIADSAVIARFKKQVKEHRAELASKGSTIDLSNFEAGL